MVRTALVFLLSNSMGLAATAPEAAQRALTLLQSSQKNWFEKQSCASCHHQVLPALAFRDAADHGIPFDAAAARADAAKALALFADVDRAVPSSTRTRSTPRWTMGTG